jgi:molybdate transport system substrate-binding protein
MRIRSSIVRTTLASALCLAVGASLASAAELTVLCSNGLKAVMEELAPRFERDTGHTLIVKYGLAAVLKARIDAGEPFDLAVLAPVLLADLVSKQIVAADAQGPIGRSGLGLFTRAGRPKPDIATTAAFTRALVEAPSITYAKEGASGVYFAGLVQKLGLADRISPKARLAATGEEVGETVARGDVALGVLPLSEILPVRGVELVGMFPPDVQSYIVMAGGVSTRARDGRAARALLDFLRSPDVLPVIKAKGMDR